MHRTLPRAKKKGITWGREEKKGNGKHGMGVYHEHTKGTGKIKVNTLRGTGGRAGSHFYVDLYIYIYIGALEHHMSSQGNYYHLL